MLIFYDVNTVTKSLNFKYTAFPQQNSIIHFSKFICLTIQSITKIRITSKLA